MFRDLHYRLTQFAKYRVFSRRQIRRIKDSLGCPDPWAYLIHVLHAHPDSIYLDIGAHVGATIERISDECSNIIHGFEPTPASFEKLQSRYSANQSVNMWNVACSDQTGKTSIFLNLNSQTNSLLDNSVGNHQYFPQHTKHIDEIEISTVRLDDWRENAPFSHDSQLLIKCDVQGAEMKVINGARETLENHCLAFYSEVQLVQMYDGQATFSEVNRALTEELGFVMKDIYPCLHDATGQALQFDALWVKPSLLH